jgi:hypothetical protein
MNKPNMANLIGNVKKTLSKHSPEILTGIGIAGMMTTTVLAVKATPKALMLIEEKKQDENVDKLTVIDTVKVTWKCYIPAAVTCVASTACLIGANSVHARRGAALATAYKLSETALAEYREKVVETIGEKKEQAVREKVAEKQVKENPVSKSDIIVTGNGDTRFFDPLSGRHFSSSVEKVKKAENELNKRMLHSICGCASLNEFYDELEIPRTDVGDILGWNTDNLIDICIRAQVDDDGQPSIVLDHNVRPEYDYDR